MTTERLGQHGPRQGLGLFWKQGDPAEGCREDHCRFCQGQAGQLVRGPRAKGGSVPGFPKKWLPTVQERMGVMSPTLGTSEIHPPTCHTGPHLALAGRLVKTSVDAGWPGPWGFGPGL